MLIFTILYKKGNYLLHIYFIYIIDNKGYLMALVIDANMKHIADSLHITSSRMIRDYGLSTVDEIIEAEAAKGNSRAVDYAREYYNSPERLIKVFQLTNIENKFLIINNMDDLTREKLLTLLPQKDLVMGLHFFKQDKLLKLMMKVDIKELVRVVLTAFPFDQIISMLNEEDLSSFFLNNQLPKETVTAQLKEMPQDMIQKFVENVTGQPMQEGSFNSILENLNKLPDDQFRKFMAAVDPDVQRQLTYQITKENPEYLLLFNNETYVNMMSTLLKPDMIAPMVMLNQDTLVNMITLLPDNLISVVASQVDEKKFATFLQDGHMDLIEKAMII